MKRFSKMLGAFALCMGLLASPAQAEKFVVGFQPYDTISYQASFTPLCRGRSSLTTCWLTGRRSAI